MIVKIGGRAVDVAGKDCEQRLCFSLGFDRGSFSQGRGYTSYHKKPRPVCMTRHLHGCPSNSVCPVCRISSVDVPGSKCGGIDWSRGNSRCPGVTVCREPSERGDA